MSTYRGTRCPRRAVLAVLVQLGFVQGWSSGCADEADRAGAEGEADGTRPDDRLDSDSSEGATTGGTTATGAGSGGGSGDTSSAGSSSTSIASATGSGAGAADSGSSSGAGGADSGTSSGAGNADSGTSSGQGAGGSGVVACGAVTCAAGEICCDPTCGICGTTAGCPDISCESGSSGAGGAGSSASCDGNCGGPAPDQSCWCDDECEQYDDCCADKIVFCS